MAGRMFYRLKTGRALLQPACCKEVLLRLPVADAAVVTAVSEINHQSNHQPDDQASPVYPAEFVHHVPVEQDAENRDDRNPGGTERPRLTGIRAAQDHNRDT